MLNQFEEFGNYRFHFHCTATAALEVVQDLGLGFGAFVSAMGSAGTIAAGEAIKRRHPGCATVAVEPVQCPTLYNVGFGAHRIEGIGDKHVTWIHNVWATDLLVGVDDQDCLGAAAPASGLGSARLRGRRRQGRGQLDRTSSGSAACATCSGAIKTARFYGLGPKDAVVTVATDGFDRYPSVLERLSREQGPMNRDEARRRLSIFRGQKSDWILEGTREVRRRWHNQKYFTWVEQQGKTVDDLRAQEDPAFWISHQERASVIDRAHRGAAR